MLKVTKDKDFIKVTKTLYGWSDTSVKTILYDLVNKKNKCNDNPWYDMSQSGINLCYKILS